jgi:D-aminopeptidase
MVALVATDAPLFPEQLRELAEAALRGIDAAAPPAGVEARVALAFSTANPLDDSLEEGFRLYSARRLGEAGLGALLDGAGEVARAALGRALTAATAVSGRKGRALAPLGPEVIARITRGSPP